jgi:phosphoglycerate dehydrogenase-like enzyme
MHDPDDAPTLLVSDQVPDDTASALADGLRERVPGADVVVATTPAEARDAAAEARGLVTYNPREALLEAGDLAWVQALSAGVDFIDVEGLRDRGVTLTNASGVHAEPIGEQVLAYMLMFERRLVTLGRQQQRGVWERQEGTELRGKTLGVVGVGAIGERVAELGQALGMEVLGTKRDTSERVDAVDELFGPAETALHEVAKRADYLVLACPLTEETEGLVGSTELRLLGDEGVLVNIARGEVVDQDALVRACQNHSIRGAALDVFETEPLPPASVLWDLSNVVVTPHMAGSTPEKVGRWLDILEPNYRALADGDEEVFVNRIV